MWLFALSYMIGFASFLFLREWTVMYLIFLFVYGAIGGHAFPEKRTVGIVHAVGIGFASSLLLTCLSGGEWGHFHWLLLSLPFFLVMNRGRENISEQTKYITLRILLSVSSILTMVLILKGWGVGEEAASVVFICSYFTMIVAMWGVLKKRRQAGVFALVQAGFLYYTCQNWIRMEGEIVTVFLLSVAGLQIYHWIRGRTPLAMRSNNF